MQIRYRSQGKVLEPARDLMKENCKAEKDALKRILCVYLIVENILVYILLLAKCTKKLNNISVLLLHT